MQAYPPSTAAPALPPSTAAPALPKRESTRDRAPKAQLSIVNHPSEHNPEPTECPAPQKQFFGTLGTRHVICLCGLPHRGRNYIASELGWYLEFFHGAEVKVFDVAEFADASGSTESRETHAEDLLVALEEFLQGSTTERPLDIGYASDEGTSCDGSVDEGKVAIVVPFCMSETELDQRLLERSHESWKHIWSCSNAMDREWVREHLTGGHRRAYKLMFVEIEVTDPSLRQEHLSHLQSESRAAFLAAEAQHRRAYTPLGRSASSEGALSYLRLINFRDMETHRMHGYLRMRVAQFLSVLRPWKHVIYLSRHGESTYNVEKKLGGNPGLSPLGHEYAKRLGSYASTVIQVDAHTGQSVCARLWTSSLIRTHQTAQHIPHPLIQRKTTSVIDVDDAEDPSVIDVADLAPHLMVDSSSSSSSSSDPAVGVGIMRMHSSPMRPSEPWRHCVPWRQMAPRAFRQLDEIYAGEYDGFTEAQIKELDPRFADERRGDKLGMRYPKGESYLDLITRLEPLVHELLSYREPLLVVSHQAVLRVLRAYLLHQPRDQCHARNIPQHTVMKFVWDGWHFPPKASPEEAKMKAKEWPPPESDSWHSKREAACAEGEKEVVGTEEWVWLGPDTKRSDGQKNI